MWIKRDLFNFLTQIKLHSVHPVKILKGPRQVGKTSLLDHLGSYKLISFDDTHIREKAQENPRLFLDQYKEPLILDEATLAPNIFFELKRRVDKERRLKLKNQETSQMDVWITGSNQTLLTKAVQESLAGRATYFDLNTLSIHELKQDREVTLADLFLKGGWPELYTHSQMSQVTYLNDLISTFIEKDIVLAAGIEKRAAFTQSIRLLSARVGQLVNYSDIAKNVGVESTTIQSWIAYLEQNALVKIVPPYYTNLNQRLLKTPKIYFEDLGLAARFQGWTTFEPLFISPQFGSLLENLVYSEISRFFKNQGLPIEIYFVRSKEKVEIDFLVKISNNRFLAIEVKSQLQDWSREQLKLIQSLKIDVVDHWVVTPNLESHTLSNAKHVSLFDLHEQLVLVHP